MGPLCPWRPSSSRSPFSEKAFMSRQRGYALGHLHRHAEGRRLPRFLFHSFKQWVSVLVCLVTVMASLSFAAERRGITVGGGCSSVARVSDRHAAEAGSIPRCGKGFSPRVNVQCRLSFDVLTPLCATTCINICPTRTLKIL